MPSKSCTCIRVRLRQWFTCRGNSSSPPSPAAPRCSTCPKPMSMSARSKSSGRSLRCFAFSLSFYSLHQHRAIIVVTEKGDTDGTHALCLGICIPFLWLQYEGSARPEDVMNPAEKCQKPLISVIEVYPFRYREPAARISTWTVLIVKTIRDYYVVPIRVFRDLVLDPVGGAKRYVMRELIRPVPSQGCYVRDR